MVLLSILHLRAGVLMLVRVRGSELGDGASSEPFLLFWRAVAPKQQVSMREAPPLPDNFQVSSGSCQLSFHVSLQLVRILQALALIHEVLELGKTILPNHTRVKDELVVEQNDEARVSLTPSASGQGITAKRQMPCCKVKWSWPTHNRQVFRTVPLTIIGHKDSRGRLGPGGVIYH
jgi:hypothetical protein